MVSGYQVEPKKGAVFSHHENKVPTESNESRTMNKGNQSNSKKKKAGKVISLAEAAKGSIVFQQGKPCSCQARQHRLISNCLSCGKIVCEQEGEGPCQFCGALMLKEGSTYAGLEENLAPLSDADAGAEAYAKRLVDYDRNSAARTTVIDDQSDYYEIEGKSWLSKEVMLNEDEVSELESENRILLRPTNEREVNRIKPNPSLRVQPIFIDPGVTKKPAKGKQTNRCLPNGLCLEITGRVRHDNNELKNFIIDSQS